MISPHSATWHAVKKHCDDRIATLTARLECDISPEDTIRVRAQVKELRGIISLVSVEVPLAEEAEPLSE